MLGILVASVEHAIVQEFKAATDVGSHKIRKDGIPALENIDWIRLEQVDSKESHTSVFLRTIIHIVPYSIDAMPLFDHVVHADGIQPISVDGKELSIVRHVPSRLKFFFGIHHGMVGCDSVHSGCIDGVVVFIIARVVGLGDIVRMGEYVTVWVSTNHVLENARHHHVGFFQETKKQQHTGW
jgi:hypothetical protein